MECQRCGFDNVQRDICSQCNAGLGGSAENERLRDEIVWLRAALTGIDAIAVAKGAGAAKKMQALARDALAFSNGMR